MFGHSVVNPDTGNPYSVKALLYSMREKAEGRSSHHLIRAMRIYEEGVVVPRMSRVSRSNFKPQARYKVTGGMYKTTSSNLVKTVFSGA